MRWYLLIAFGVLAFAGGSRASGQAATSSTPDTLALRFVDGTGLFKQSLPRTYLVREDQPFVVKITGLVPKWRDGYVVDVQRVQISPTPPAVSADVKLQVLIDTSTCADTAMAKVNTASSERAAEKLSLEALRKASQSGCPMDVRTMLANASSLVVRTFTLGSDEELDVVVRRHGAESRFRVTTSRHGEWLTSYGFVFFPHGSDRYGAVQNPDQDQGGFIITDQGRKQGGDMAGAAVFHWLPRRWGGSALAPSLVAGFGVNSSDPLVLAGLGLSYRTNVTAIGGIMGHRQGVVRPQYHDGQLIQEFLESDQLVESTFRPNWYLGLAVRFGSNPFSATDDSAPASGRNGDDDSGSGREGEGGVDDAGSSSSEERETGNAEREAFDAALNPATFQHLAGVQRHFRRGNVMLCRPSQGSATLTANVLTIPLGVEESELAPGSSKVDVAAEAVSLGLAIQARLAERGFDGVREVQVHLLDCS